ncbi:uncharacterized protein LOC134220073 isoform X2 [Armigeres subalbatus]|uniref:uncharacterized protein LOC134220073 isoform X2 n=1 Tax=Armigeres subalbatus TaxID=124917 RepID=UPI002ED306DC
MKIVKLLRTILLFALIRPGRSQCSVNLQEHLGPLEPLFIKDGQLWAPDGPALTWEAHESTIVACSKVKFINASNNTAYLTCVSGQDFLVDETPLNSVELQCSGRMTGEVDDTGEQCGSNGTLLKLGFDVESVGFVTYIESCYDRPDASVIFTKHIIPGKAIARSEIQAKKFLQGGSYYLARGHLAPDADGVYRSWQWATFFYVNVAPQWQVINAGNWLVVENLSRSKAGQLQEDLVVYDGVHDVLLLPHADGQSIPITLEAAGIRVPKWYWKIIISPVASAGIAFITNNDPFRVDMPDNELLCEDVCQQYGWNEVRFKNFTRGYTYCCTVDGLREAINDIPREFQVNYVLHKREE